MVHCADIDRSAGNQDNKISSHGVPATTAHPIVGDHNGDRSAFDRSNGA
jgi:hypothetical protein